MSHKYKLFQTMVITVLWSLTQQFQGEEKAACFRQPGIGEEASLGQWGFIKKDCEEEIVVIHQNKL